MTHTMCFVRLISVTTIDYETMKYSTLTVTGHPSQTYNSCHLHTGYLQLVEPIQSTMILEQLLRLITKLSAPFQLTLPILSPAIIINQCSSKNMMVIEPCLYAAKKELS